MVFDFSSLSVINVSAPAVCSCHDLVVDTDSVDAVDTLLLCLSFQFCLRSIPLSMFTLPFFFFFCLTILKMGSPSVKRPRKGLSLFL